MRNGVMTRFQVCEAILVLPVGIAVGHLMTPLAGLIGGVGGLIALLILWRIFSKKGQQWQFSLQVSLTLSGMPVMGVLWGLGVSAGVAIGLGVAATLTGIAASYYWVPKTTI